MLVPSDADNRLVEVEKNQTTVGEYVYDGDGSRVKSVAGGVTTLYIGNYFEWRVEASGSTGVNYYYAGSQRVAMRVGTTLSYLFGDHLGSTSITADASGSLSGELRYLPFGETRYTSGQTPTSFRYTGQREDSTINLYWYNSRWYDASLGRWSQPDSIIPSDVQGVQAWDRYAYVNNNPVKYNDPSGHLLEGGIYPGTSCAGVGPLEPTLVMDQNGITLSNLMKEPSFVEQAIKKVNAFLDPITPQGSVPIPNFRVTDEGLCFYSPGYPDLSGYMIYMKPRVTLNNGGSITLGTNSTKVDPLTVSSSGFKIEVYESKYNNLASSLNIGAKFPRPLNPRIVTASTSTTASLGGLDFSYVTGFEASVDPLDLAFATLMLAGQPELVPLLLGSGQLATSPVR